MDKSDESSIVFHRSQSGPRGHRTAALPQEGSVLSDPPGEREALAPGGRSLKRPELGIAVTVTGHKHTAIE